MSILGVNDVLGAYQYANRTQKTSTSEVGFAASLQSAGETSTSKVDAYILIRTLISPGIRRLRYPPY